MGLPVQHCCFERCTRDVCTIRYQQTLDPHQNPLEFCVRGGGRAENCWRNAWNRGDRMRRFGVSLLLGRLREEPLKLVRS